VSCNAIKATSNTNDLLLRNLINKWREHTNGCDPETTQLQEKVNEWRKQRNEVIHGIVKSYPGNAPVEIKTFFKMAKQVAQEGGTLARKVHNWKRKKSSRTKVMAWS
jgi:hypothetical protein